MQSDWRVPPILGALCNVVGVQGVQLLVLLKGFFSCFQFRPLKLTRLFNVCPVFSKHIFSSPSELIETKQPLCRPCSRHRRGPFPGLMRLFLWSEAPFNTFLLLR